MNSWTELQGLGVSVLMAERSEIEYFIKAMLKAKVPKVEILSVTCVIFPTISKGILKNLINNKESIETG
jgi:hypothetical protein